jgi:hypothetical protein
MFMSTMTSKYHINVFKASHQHQIILTLVNLAKDLTILQKKASSMSSIFKFFTSFDCTPAHDTAHLHLSSCLHMSGKPKFSENAISHKQKKQGITTGLTGVEPLCGSRQVSPEGTGLTGGAHRSDRCWSVDLRLVFHCVLGL